jgi:hypothetical protein
MKGVLFFLSTLKPIRYTTDYMKYRLMIVAAALTIFIVPSVRALSIDYNRSRVSSDQAELTADGIDNAEIEVKIADGFGVGIEGITVTLSSSRGSQDEITVEDGVTNQFGKALFRVKSLWRGTSVYTAKVGDMVVSDTAEISYTGGLSIDLGPGDLIKIPDDGSELTQSDSAVYYYAKNGKRYVFPNEKTYFSWYADFRNVKTIPLDQMSFIPIGGNVTYKPGSRLVKFQTDVKTYAVSHGGVLRWLRTEEAARTFYGSNWNTQVDDVSEAFYTNYTFGEPLEASDIYVRSMQADLSQSIDADKEIK